MHDFFYVSIKVVYTGQHCKMSVISPLAYKLIHYRSISLGIKHYSSYTPFLI